MSCHEAGPKRPGPSPAGPVPGDDPLPGNDRLIHELLGSASVFASVVGTIVNEALDRVSGEHALSLGQLRFLELISHGDEASVSDIARSVQISNAAVSRNLDKLVDRGLVDRRPGTDDRRTVKLSLTAAGDAVLAEYRARITATLVQSLEAETSDNLPDITAALDRMTLSLLGARSAEPPPCRGCIAVQPLPPRRLSAGRGSPARGLSLRPLRPRGGLGGRPTELPDREPWITSSFASATWP